MLSVERVGVRHGSVLLNLGEGLPVSMARIQQRGTYEVPSLLLDETEVTFVDDAPNTETFALKTSVTSAEGKIPDQPLGTVESWLNNRLDEVANDTGHIVVRLKNQSTLESKNVSASARVAQVLRWARGEKRPGCGKVALQQ